MSIASVISSVGEIISDSRLVPISDTTQQFLESESTTVTRRNYMIEEHGLLLPRGRKKNFGRWASKKYQTVHLPFETSQFNKNPSY